MWVSVQYVIVSVLWRQHKDKKLAVVRAKCQVCIFHTTFQLQILNSSSNKNQNTALESPWLPLMTLLTSPLRTLPQTKHKACGGHRENLLRFLLTHTAKSGFPEHHLVFPPSQLVATVRFVAVSLRRCTNMCGQKNAKLNNAGKLLSAWKSTQQATGVMGEEWGSDVCRQHFTFKWCGNFSPTDVFFCGFCFFFCYQGSIDIIIWTKIHNNEMWANKSAA